MLPVKFWTTSTRRVLPAVLWTVHMRGVTTQRLQYAQHGDPEKVVELTSVEIKDSVGYGQIRVKWMASPINPADINQIEGIYPIKPSLPSVGGNEACGLVAMVGAGVQRFAVGDRVVPSRSGAGCWTQMATYTGNDLYKIDSDLTLAAAATLQVNPPTAYRMLKDFVDLEPGDFVVQNGANSGVGRAVIQLAKEFGLRTINLIRERPEIDKLINELTDLGADMVLTEKQLREIRSSTKVKLALNCVGGRSSLLLASVLAQNGAMVTYGGMSKQPVQTPTGALIFQNIRLYGFWMSHWYYANSDNPERDRMYAQLTDLIKKGRLAVPPMDHIPLTDYKRALANAVKSSGRKQLLIL